MFLTQKNEAQALELCVPLFQMVCPSQYNVNVILKTKSVHTASYRGGSVNHPCNIYCYCSGLSAAVAAASAAVTRITPVSSAKYELLPVTPNVAGRPESVYAFEPAATAYV